MAWRAAASRCRRSRRQGRQSRVQGRPAQPDVAEEGERFRPADRDFLTACQHCGLPAVAGARFCCAGCEAVAGTIAAAGLGAYYETRTAPALRPEPLPEFQAPKDLTESALILERVRCAACLWLIEQVLRRHPA
jgi:hypothetical protein